ncbi:trypsin-like peptidase domain-containing protein [Streptomyces olivaceus]|nr:trypsin-like peptidase domain-containing protein [Streptomyces olivaceus]MBZ6179374.1 trypsin-like peptidase domain-containing protein [Streptomyces olivaceus]
MAAGGGAPADSWMRTPSWAVRIRGADGEIAGAGILLTPDRVLTCAHVVDRTADRMTAEFVGAADRSVPAVPARLDGDAYVPETRDADGDPSGDVALLRLERPRPPRTRYGCGSCPRPPARCGCTASRTSTTAASGSAPPPSAAADATGRSSSSRPVRVSWPAPGAAERASPTATPARSSAWCSAVRRTGTATGSPS